MSTSNEVRVKITFDDREFADKINALRSRLEGDGDEDLSEEEIKRKRREQSRFLERLRETIDIQSGRVVVKKADVVEKAGVVDDADTVMGTDKLVIPETGVNRDGIEVLAFQSEIPGGGGDIDANAMLEIQGRLEALEQDSGVGIGLTDLTLGRLKDMVHKAVYRPQWAEAWAHEEGAKDINDLLLMVDMLEENFGKDTDVYQLEEERHTPIISAMSGILDMVKYISTRSGRATLSGFNKKLGVVKQAVVRGRLEPDKRESIFHAGLKEWELEQRIGMGKQGVAEQRFYDESGGGWSQPDLSDLTGMGKFEQYYMGEVGAGEFGKGKKRQLGEYGIKLVEEAYRSKFAVDSKKPLDDTDLMQMKSWIDDERKKMEAGERTEPLFKLGVLSMPGTTGFSRNLPTEMISHISTMGVTPGERDFWKDLFAGVGPAAKPLFSIVQSVLPDSLHNKLMLESKMGYTKEQLKQSVDEWFTNEATEEERREMLKMTNPMDEDQYRDIVNAISARTRDIGSSLQRGDRGAAKSAAVEGYAAGVTAAGGDEGKVQDVLSDVYRMGGRQGLGIDRIRLQSTMAMGILPRALGGRFDMVDIPMNLDEIVFDMFSRFVAPERGSDDDGVVGRGMAMKPGEITSVVRGVMAEMNIKDPADLLRLFEDVSKDPNQFWDVGVKKRLSAMYKEWGKTPRLKAIMDKFFSTESRLGLASMGGTRHILKLGAMMGGDDTMFASSYREISDFYDHIMQNETIPDTDKQLVSSVYTGMQAFFKSSIEQEPATSLAYWRFGK